MKQRQEAYTLIEILIVIMIIGLLSAAGVTSYVRALQNGRDARRKSDISDVQQALVMYRYEKGSYPSGDFETIADKNDAVLVKNGNLSHPVTPQDATNFGYIYRRNDNGTSFVLCAKLERPTGNSSNTGSCSGNNQCTYSAVAGGTGSCECYLNP